MENKELYDLIEKFLNSIKMSRRKFAKIAGIPPTTFQHKIEKKNNIRTDTYHKLADAMGSILDKEQDESIKQELTGILDRFVTAYEASHAEDLALEQRIYDLLNNPSCFDLSSSFSESISLEESMIRICDAYDLLNEKGRKIAAERVAELTKIPDYRKDNE